MSSSSKDINFAINAQEQTLNSIKSLQNLEKRLYENLEKLSSSNKDNNLQKQIVNKINDISQTKIVLFDQFSLFIIPLLNQLILHLNLLFPSQNHSLTTQFSQDNLR